MRLVVIAAENDALPAGKVGGIGDVIREYPLALAEKEHQVEVITPGYGMYLSGKVRAEHKDTLDVLFAGTIERVELFRYYPENSHALVCQWVLDHPLFAACGVGSIYCTDASREVFAQDSNKFALFCMAAATALVTNTLPKPEVIHLHDWHGAFFSLLQHYGKDFSALKSIHTVLTIHNLAVQGIRPFEANESSLSAWFPFLSYPSSEVCDPQYRECVNPLRAAIRLADRVHIVSPSYAEEITRPSRHADGFYGGEGLEQDLVQIKESGRLVGILNGCNKECYLTEKRPATTDKTKAKERLIQYADSALFNWMAKQPELLSSHYIAHQKLKAWQQRAKPDEMIITSVGRLTPQKVLLLTQTFRNSMALEQILDRLGGQGVFLMTGSGDALLESIMTQVMARHENFIFLQGYDEPLARALYQVGDLFVMPSSFEPCGISQMLAMQRGQPCLVHSIGGLKDTVTDGKNGFSFSGATIAEQVENMIKTFELALDCRLNRPAEWARICESAAEMRFSWQEAVDEYLDKLYLVES